MFWRSDSHDMRPAFNGIDAQVPVVFISLNMYCFKKWSNLPKQFETGCWHLVHSSLFCCHQWGKGILLDGIVADSCVSFPQAVLKTPNICRSSAGGPSDCGLLGSLCRSTSLTFSPRKKTVKTSICWQLAIHVFELFGQVCI